MTTTAFKQQTEKLLSMMNDEDLLENYIKMYSDIKNGGNVTPETLKALLICCYQLAMENNSTSSCLYSDQIINAVVISCVSILYDIINDIFIFYMTFGQLMLNNLCL
jgi:hypothetical protein